MPAVNSKTAELMAEYEDLKQRWDDLRGRIQPVHDEMQAEYDAAFREAQERVAAGDPVDATIREQLENLKEVQRVGSARVVLESQWWDKRREQSTI